MKKLLKMNRLKFTMSGVFLMSLSKIIPIRQRVITHSLLTPIFGCKG